MRKMDFIHLHGLLAETTDYLDEKETEDVDTSEYESLGVTPTDIHLQKGDHKEAVMTLVNELADFAEENMSDDISPGEEATDETPVAAD